MIMAVLIIFPVILQTGINLIMLSIGEGQGEDALAPYPWYTLSCVYKLKAKRSASPYGLCASEKSLEGEKGKCLVVAIALFTAT